MLGGRDLRGPSIALLVAVLLVGPVLALAIMTTRGVGGDLAAHTVEDHRRIVLLGRDLERDLWIGVVGTAAAAAALGFLLARMYSKVARQRDALLAAESRLQLANVGLTDADRAKSAFMAEMSHELRTPMNAILGFTDLLTEQLDATLSDRHRRFLANIHLAGEQLLGLINDVLDLSKVDSGRLQIRPEVMDAAALLVPVADSGRTAALAAGLTFAYQDQASGLVRLDPGRTRQIALTLLSNAVKYTPAPGGVTFTSQILDDALVLAVTDTGIGITEEARGRVFAPFERVDRHVPGAEGTGLGLALTKRLVELQGGSITFESVPDRGTTFTVVLPDARYSVMSSQSVLIVEDDRPDAELLTVLATDAGLATHRVTTLAAALEATRRVRPLAVILDLYLPDGHGALILEMLKSAPDTADVPVLVVTSGTDIARFRLMGAECMTKPIDTRRVRAWLDRISAALAA